MAPDNRVAADAETLEPPRTSSRGPQINADARVAPTCMLWATIVGLAFLVGTILVWAIPHLGEIFR